ncbi:MAG: hypothetical protein FWJ74_09765 [Gemmatimonadota bacterium]
MRWRTIGTTMVVVLATAWPADTLGQHVKGVRGSRGWLPAIGEAGTAAAVVEAVRGPEIAETAAQRVAVPVDRSRRARIGGWRPLSVAKWGMLGLTAVAAVYGLSASLEADGLYDRISEICATDASRCEALPEGGYADDEVANLDRDARALDERARRGLLATQIGVAATLALFILDLRDSGPPPNVPYVPPQFRVGIGRDGALRVAGRIAMP